MLQLRSLEFQQPAARRIGVPQLGVEQCGVVVEMVFDPLSVEVDESVIGNGARKRQQAQKCTCEAHQLTLTARIMPAFMWYSR